MSNPKSPAEPSLRADAARNQQRIVEAAREVFAAQGLEAPLEHVAKAAGVGIATLYRRFPTRDDLIAATFQDKARAYADAAEAALHIDDPWEAFSQYIYTVCEMQAGNAGLADLLALTFARHPSLRQEHARGYEAFLTLVRRAQEAGALRADFVDQDLPLMLMGNAGVISATRHDAPQSWERFAAYMIQAFRAPGADVLPEPPPRAAVVRALDSIAKS